MSRLLLSACVVSILGCAKAPPEVRLFYCGFNSMEIRNKAVLASWYTNESTSYLKVDLMLNDICIATLFDSRHDHALLSIGGDSKVPVERSFFAEDSQPFFLAKVSSKDVLTCRISGLGFDGKDRVLSRGDVLRAYEGFAEISGEGWKLKLKVRE